MGSRGWGFSGINQIVEEAGNEGIKGGLLGLEELLFGFAHFAALWRVAVIGVIRDGDVLRSCPVIWQNSSRSFVLASFPSYRR